MRRLLLPAVLVFAATLVAAPVAMAVKRDRTGTVRVRDSRYGKVLFDGKGYALYDFTLDRRGSSRCYGRCAEAWPPMLVRKGRAPTAIKGARGALLGTVKRRGGSVQVTYAGQPLYYYVGDPARAIFCHDVLEFGGRWLVVGEKGKPVR